MRHSARGGHPRAASLAVGLVEQTVIPSVPVHVEYSLTELGRSATAPLAHIRSWVEQNIHQVPAYSGHPAQSAHP